MKDLKTFLSPYKNLKKKREILIKLKIFVKILKY